MMLWNPLRYTLDACGNNDKTREQDQRIAQLELRTSELLELAKVVYALTESTAS